MLRLFYQSVHYQKQFPKNFVRVYIIINWYPMGSLGMSVLIVFGNMLANAGILENLNVWYSGVLQTVQTKNLVPLKCLLSVDLFYPRRIML